MLHYIEETTKEHYLVSMNEVVCESCAVSSVDVPCSDVIVRFDILFIGNITPL